jgi:hypothetical protein
MIMETLGVKLQCLVKIESNSDDNSGRVVSEDLARQTRQALSNLQVCLGSQGRP